MLFTIYIFGAIFSYFLGCYIAGKLGYSPDDDIHFIGIVLILLWPVSIVVIPVYLIGLKLNELGQNAKNKENK